MAWDNTSRRSAELPRDWPVIRRDILERDHHECQLRGPRCIGHATDVDHKGDRHDHSRTNLRAACSSCHAQRSSQQGQDAARAARALTRHPAELHPGLAG